MYLVEIELYKNSCFTGENRLEEPRGPPAHPFREVRGGWDFHVVGMLACRLALPNCRSYHWWHNTRIKGKGLRIGPGKLLMCGQGGVGIKKMDLGSIFLVTGI